MKTVSINTVSLLSFLFLFLSGCASGGNENHNALPPEVSELENLTILPAEIQPTHDIFIQEDNVIGDGAGDSEPVIGQIRDIAVDDSGRVYLADTQQKTIHVFGPDGQFLTNLGRSGLGPGEFGHISDMRLRGNKLFTFDPTLFRMNFYSLESLSFDHTEVLFVQDWADIQNLERAFPMDFYDWGGDNVLIGFLQSLDGHIYYYLVHNSNAKTSIISDPILVQELDTKTEITIPFGDGVIGIDPPFARKPLMTVSKDRHIFSAWSERFLIEEYDSMGTYLSALYYPYNALSLTQEELDSFASSRGQFQSDIQDAWDANPPPATWPVLDDMIVDDEDRLWISTIVEDPEVTEWWVLEKTGTLLARFTWPKHKAIEIIKTDYFYTKEIDSETRVQKIVRYRVDLRKR